MIAQHGYALLKARYADNGIYAVAVKNRDNSQPPNGYKDMRASQPIRLRIFGILLKAVPLKDIYAISCERKVHSNYKAHCGLLILKSSSFFFHSAQTSIGLYGLRLINSWASARILSTSCAESASSGGWRRHIRSAHSNVSPACSCSSSCQ